MVADAELSGAEYGRIAAMLQPAFPGARLVSAARQEGPPNSTSFRISVSSQRKDFVVRVYASSDACRVERDVAGLVGHLIPTPGILFCDPDSVVAGAPFSILEQPEGQSLRQLVANASLETLSQAGYQTGAALARIRRHQFPGPGRFRGGARVVPTALDDDANPFLEDLRVALAGAVAGQRLGGPRRERIERFAEGEADLVLPFTREAGLVHGSLWGNGISMRSTGGRWFVDQVFGWTAAYAGPTLADIGSLLRWDPPEAFVQPLIAGYEAGGAAGAQRWRQCALLLDLAPQVRMLDAREISESEGRRIIARIDALMDTWSALES